MVVSTNTALRGFYDYGDVARSILIAIAASYAALEFTRRTTAPRDRTRWTWLACGTLAMSIGIWSGSFKGMVAFHLPVPVAYYWPTVLATFVVAVAASAVSFFLAGRQRMGPFRFLTASVVMGGGIAAVHYTGMSAMRSASVVHFDFRIVVLSVLVAIGFSWAALVLAFALPETTASTAARRFGSAIVMAIAICGMHYTGMAAASFVPASEPPDLFRAANISPLTNNAIAMVTFLVLGAALFTSAADRRLAAQSQELERRVTERTRQLKTLNEQLTRSESRFRLLFERNMAGVLVVSQGKLVDCNAASSRILGYNSPDEIRGRPTADFYFDPADQQSIFARLSRESAALGELRLKRKDGSPVSVLFNCLASSGENNTPIVLATMIDLTEMKRSDETVREYAKVVEGLEEMIYVVDRNHRFVLANQSFLSYSNLEREQVVGRLVSEIIGDEPYRTTILEKLDACFQGSVVTFGMTYTHPNRGERVLNISNYPIEGPTGIDRAACVLRDITERQRAEAAKLRLAAIVQSSDDAIISKDGNGVITSWNKAAERIFGYSAAEAIAQPITILVPPELREEQRDLLRRLQTGEPVQQYETTRITKQGKSVEVSLTLSPLRDSEGQIVGTCTIARDISERKRAERTLRKSEAEARARVEEMAAILDAVPGMTLIARDAECRWVNGSRTAYDVLRAPYGSNLSMTPGYGERLLSVRAIQDGRQLSPEELPLQKAASTGQAVRESEVTLVFDDGTTCTMLGNAAPLLDSKGTTVRGAVGVFIDISQRKLTEQALHGVEAELAHVTRVLTMGELVASIAHEVNQPLTAVVTNSNFALRQFASGTPDLGELRQVIAEIVEDATRISDVILRIRAMLQKGAPNRAEVHLNELIMQVTTFMRNATSRSHVYLSLDLAAGLPHPQGDRVQLQQVLINLVMNGIDAMRTNTDRPRDLIIRSAKSDEGILVQVQDSGIGLDPDRMNRIFEPFFTTKPQGIGMGLSISRSIIEAHGGRLWAEPLANGTIFQFSLPITEDQAS